MTAASPLCDPIGDDPLARLRQEARLVAGPVPDTIDDAVVARADFVGGRDAFLLIPTPGLRFHYRRHQGVRCAAAPRFDEAAIATFHHGSVWGALAWLNGFLPMHASAVTRDGRVHGFAGVSGAGKSTLVAALSARGWPLFADDVLTLDVAAGALPSAMPGHKRLKLWGDALMLTGRTGAEPVWPGLDKYYVDVGGLDHPTPLPLASLTVIEAASDDEAPTTARLTGVAAFAALHAHCYRADLRLPDRAASAFADLTATASTVPVYRLRRSRAASRFDEGVDAVVRHLTALAP